MRLPSLRGSVSPVAYAIAAPALVLSQHAAVALLFWLSGQPLVYDFGFWMLPMRRLAAIGQLSPLGSALAFMFGLLIAWAVAVLSFRRAMRARHGFASALFSVVPILQIPAIIHLATAPPVPDEDEPVEDPDPEALAMLKGLLAGMAIIVFAVLVSAVSFGAYGYGLFVLTPFLVGITTGYIANRPAPLEPVKTTGVVLAAAGLGCVALMMFALEGLVCILLAAPLGALAAAAGGSLGRGIALLANRRARPLLSVALLPAVFVVEAAIPPALAITNEQSIVIAAPAADVWRALTRDGPIDAPPGLVGRAGLAYAVGGRIVEPRVGGERLGAFSTGLARERITAWEPERRLAFAVVSQPPAMEEMSPYRRVHAPHVDGYFVTAATSFELRSLPGDRTRLTARASHVLRLDPVLYWEPLARWAIRANTSRVLRHIRDMAEDT